MTHSIHDLHSRTVMDTSHQQALLDAKMAQIGEYVIDLICLDDLPGLKARYQQTEDYATKHS